MLPAPLKAVAKCAPPGPPPAPKGKGKTAAVPVVDLADPRPLPGGKGKGKCGPPTAPAGGEVAKKVVHPSDAPPAPGSKGKGKCGPPTAPAGGRAAKKGHNGDTAAGSNSGKSGVPGAPPEDWRETLKQNKADGSQRHRIAAEPRAPKPCDLPSRQKPVDRVTKKAGIWTIGKLLEAQHEDGHFDAHGVAAQLKQIYRAELIQPPCDAFAELAGKPDSFATALVLRAAGIYLSKGDPDPISSRNLEHRQEHGRVWLEQYEVSDEMKSNVESLLDAWFALPRVEGKGGKKGKVISDEQRRKAEQEMQRRAMARQDEEQGRVEHWKTLRPRPLQDVPWQDAVMTMYSDGGSGGAVLVQLGSAEAIVLKPQGLSAASEMLAVAVSTELGVRVAECRVLAPADDEYGFLLRKLLATPTMVDGHENYVRRTVGGRECVGVVEFVQGCVLQGVAGQATLAGSTSASTLRQLGALIALDCVLNNVDRIPAIWMNDGNLGNVMVSPAGEVVGIDQQVNFIRDTTLREAYSERVREFVLAAAGQRLDAPSFLRVRQALLTNCGFEAGPEAGAALLAGAFKQFQCIAQNAQIIQHALPAIGRRVKAAFAHATRRHGQSEVDHMLDFVGSNVNVIAAAIGTLPKSGDSASA